MTIYCRHHDCQCDTAAELAWLSGNGRTDALVAAVAVHKENKEVRCRHVPRRGRVNAPFAPRKEV